MADSESTERVEVVSLQLMATDNYHIAGNTKLHNFITV